MKRIANGIYYERMNCRHIEVARINRHTYGTPGAPLWLLMVDNLYVSQHGTKREAVRHARYAARMEVTP